MGWWHSIPFPTEWKVIKNSMKNPHGSSHHQSDQSVYAEQHPNSQDNQKSLLLLSRWIIGSLCEAPKCPSAVGRFMKPKLLVVGEGLFTFTSPMVCTMIGWAPFYSILGVNSASSLLRLQTARPRHSKLPARCQNPVLPEFLQRRKGGIILPLCLLQQKHDSPSGLLCPNPCDVPQVDGSAKKHCFKTYNYIVFSHYWSLKNIFLDPPSTRKNDGSTWFYRFTQNFTTVSHVWLFFLEGLGRYF